jgi:2-polyprenyl-3-methyl-5-hydroxy-6-metoxy-1,4-benzoquinol methylase
LGTQWGRHLRREFSYWRCAACGFVRVEPFAGYAIYDDAYYAGRGADPFVDYAAEYRDYRQTDREIEFADVSRVVGRRLTERGARGEISWLDYGCGAGGLLKYLRAAGAIATGGGELPLRLAGHDVGAYADRLRTADGFSILGGDELDALPAGSFDVITLIEVIEHIPDPGTIVARCARLLRPGGVLLLTTGNFDCPVARVRGLAYRYCIPEIHVSLFCPSSLAALYARHGLTAWTTRYDGVVRFKVLKGLPAAWRPVARRVLKWPGITRLIDRAYGVSAMPSACLTT